MGRKKKNGGFEIHEELRGFNIKINEFGEINSSFSIEKLNTFLNRKVEDKKLKEVIKQNRKPEWQTIFLFLPIPAQHSRVIQ